MALPFHKLPGSSSLSGIVLANGTSAATSRKVNLAGSSAPTVTDDSAAGYGVGSRWLDTTNIEEYVCLDASVGAADWLSTTAGTNPVNSSLRETITLSNSFTAGDVIRRTSVSYVESQADSVSNAEVFGVVESSTGSNFVIVYSGILNWTGHGFAVGASLFLSPTVAGLLTATEPSSITQISKLVAIVKDADSIEVIQGRGRYIDGGVAQATETSAGIAEIATQAETDAGSDNTRFITPVKLANNPRIPSQAENDALQGTSGVASGSNRYVTNSDSRNTDSRSPTAHATSHAPAGSDALPWTTIHGRGLASARPSAASSNAGYVYYSTDSFLLERSNGTTWDSISATGSSVNLTVYTSSGTFTVPAGITKIKVTNVGGGGGGGGSSGSGANVASGGGGGATSVKVLTVVPAAAHTVTIGAAGAAGTSGGGTGGTGGDTTFGTGPLLTGKGGVGGVDGAGSSIAGGAGGATSSADYSVSGENGKPGFIAAAASTSLSGAGGHSLYGFGGNAVFSNSAGQVGKGYGAGGGGAFRSNAGGAGTAGLCLVEWVG